jgi:beta-glucosidase
MKKQVKLSETVESNINKSHFGRDFIWGVSTSAAQIEGAWNLDGKGISNWDQFATIPKVIANGDSPSISADFYHRFKEDIEIIKSLNISNFRFSISWSRLIPDGRGKVNEKGIDFYNQVIDYCIELNIEPWITVYHWDLPYSLEKMGGWSNREIIKWFEGYVTLCANSFGDRVKNWMVLNEPLVFTGAGYFIGKHAPGKKGFRNFLPAFHHTMLCQSLGIKVLKKILPNAEIGTTFSYTHVIPHSNSTRDKIAAEKADIILNKLCIEPLLGLGYPFDKLPVLKRMKKYMLDGDEELLMANPDFIGIQVYTREVVSHSIFVPYLQLKHIPAAKRTKNLTMMDWEIYPPAIYEAIRSLNKYDNIKKIIVTENGAAFKDDAHYGFIVDVERIQFLSENIKEVLRARQDGYKVDGYFVWSLMDNFEWTYGYKPTFGLVHIDYGTQKRTIKNSGLWYRDFLGDL